jgi:hypothetical protein
MLIVGVPAMAEKAVTINMIIAWYLLRILSPTILIRESLETSMIEDNSTNQVLV